MNRDRSHRLNVTLVIRSSGLRIPNGNRGLTTSSTAVWSTPKLRYNFARFPGGSAGSPKSRGTEKRGGIKCLESKLGKSFKEKVCGFYVHQFWFLRSEHSVVLLRRARSRLGLPMESVTPSRLPIRAILASISRSTT